MRIKLNFSGYLPDRHSKFANKEFLTDGIPTYSFPLSIENYPKDTQYFAIALIDHDANPVVSFSWIHWLATNIEINNGIIPSDLINNSTTATFGQNSFASPVTNITNEKIIFNYAGPTPPDRDHNYLLSVYALAKKLPLEKGFYYNDFLNFVLPNAIDFSEMTFLAKC